MDISNILQTLIHSPILYCITLIVMVMLLRKGLFKLNIGGLTLGRSPETERRIIASQISYCTLSIEAIANQLCKDLNHINSWHIKYVLEKILDEYVRRISVNHLTSDEVYIEDVVLTILAITRKRANDPYFYTKEFDTYVYNETKKIITHCVDIRSRMSK